MAVGNRNIAVGLVAFAPIPLALKLGKACLPTTFHSAKEILVGSIQVFQSVLQSTFVWFP